MSLESPDTLDESPQSRSIMSFTPIPLSSLNILINENIATLNLNEGEFDESFDSVPMIHRNDNGIASLYSLRLAIEHKNTFALNESPSLASVVVDLIANVLAFFESDALGE